jgi:poly-beta-1,6-N-acetyl-D-glucosamine synthase
MTWVFITFFLSYLIFVFILIKGWRKTAVGNVSEIIQPSERCSIIIPVRNESKTIRSLLDDLLHQSYKNFEVIVVNDHSIDQTGELISQYMATDSRLKLYHSTNEGKKAALSQGIMESTGEIILTTDGDCRIGKRWLEGMMRSFQKKEIQFVFGGVKIMGDSFFSRIQSHEFLSLIGTAVASLAYDFPTMCNGANLAFRKSAFMEVGGYSGNFHVASGDDEFLMRKIFLTYPTGISFAKGADTVVATRAADTLKQFFHQRIRWAGKWRHNPSLPTQLLALSIFTFHTSVILLLLGALRGWVDLSMALALLIIKAIAECFFLKYVARYLDVKWNWAAFTVLQVMYPFYVVGTAFVSNFSSYEWKGRKLKSFTVSSVEK